MKNYLLFRAWARCRQSTLLYFLVLCYVPVISAQNTPISGTVADAKGILPGVTIQVKNKLTNTTTDANGAFQIAAAPEDILVFSYIGYLTQEVPVSNQTTFSIVLKEDTTQLDEVLINAGYYKVKDKERTGNIAKITAKEIETQPVSNFLATMQGRMAGVNITQTTGVPGGGFDIQIRGLNSIRTEGNDPLYIIDGVPYSSESMGSGHGSTVIPGRPSPLNSINPDQIESIEVLKDADATAIYGSRGANGVVLITTKRGKAGKTRFTATISTGLGRVANFMNVLSTQEYLSMRADAFEADGITSYPISAYDINGTWDKTRQTNWQKELLGKTAEYNSIQASASGGSENTQYLMSAGINKQTTVFPGEWNYKKGNVLINANHTSENKKFRSTFTGSYTIQNNLQPRTDPSIKALSLAPNAPTLRDSIGQINWENGTWNNPLSDLVPEYHAITYDLNANAILSYALNKNIELKSNFGYNTTHNDEITLLPSTRFNPTSNIGPEASSMISGKYARSSWIIEPQINWHSQWNSLKIDMILGGSFQSQKSTQLTQAGTGFSSNSLIENLASANSVVTYVSDENLYKYQAFFGRIHLDYNSKYLINLTGRRDGSSRFGPGKQFAYFGAVGAAWIFSKENFLKDNSLLSFGKLRASYGVTGNDQIGNYQFLDTYSSTGINYNGTIGLQPVRLFNPNFGWETNKKFEIALETGFLNDRIFLTTAAYRNISSNQLTGMPLPGTTGFTSMIVNLNATVENSGIEVTLRTENIKTKHWEWTTSLNISKASNKLKEFPNLESSSYKNSYVIGEPLSIRKMYHATGVDPETGLYTFEDMNGDGIISADDRQKVMDLTPEYFGGLHNQFRYKRLSLGFLLQFVKQQNYKEDMLFSVPGMMVQQPVSALNYWKKPGDIATHQILTNGSNNNALVAFDRYYNSDAMITDASFIRLKNVSISYELPSNILKNMSCKIFLEAQNLFTFTSYKGPDPEFKNTGYLPPLRIISSGVQFTF